jgi:hypothetical protein
VHVPHILRKLGGPNRLEVEAAAIAHRLSPPPARQAALDGDRASVSSARDGIVSG